VNIGPTDDELIAAMSAEELDKFLDDLLDSPDLEITPPDLLMSVAYKWAGDNTVQVKVMAGALPSSVVRAKGFIEENGKMLLFSFVQGDWTIEDPHIPAERVKHKNVIVFIGPPESMEGIETATQTGSWINMGEYQPYST
jgi:G3E family GTPase